MAKTTTTSLNIAKARLNPVQSWKTTQPECCRAWRRFQSQKARRESRLRSPPHRSHPRWRWCRSWAWWPSCWSLSKLVLSTSKLSLMLKLGLVAVVMIIFIVIIIKFGFIHIEIIFDVDVGPGRFITFITNCHNSQYVHCHHYSHDWLLITNKKL